MELETTDTIAPKKVYSEETRRKMSEAAKARAPISEQTRQRMSESQKGLPKSEEHRAKISAANKGKKRSPERIRTMSDNKSSVGKTQTDGTQWRIRKKDL